MSESIKNKIAALLAKAESTNNEFEAAAFMTKVNELLEKHQIEMYEIRKAGEDKDPLGTETGMTNIYASIQWAQNVASSLAKYYGCRTVWWKVGNHFEYQVIGRESARTTFELMLPFVISQVKQEAKKLLGQYGRSASIWQREVGQALWVRIHHMVKAAEERREELASNALIPVDAIDAYMAEQFGELKKGKSRKISFTNVAKEAAGKVSLHHQATGKHTKLLEG